MKRPVAVLSVVLALAACGNKGPLVMPEAKPAEQPAATAPAEPASAEPAAAEPATTESGTPAR